MKDKSSEIKFSIIICCFNVLDVVQTAVESAVSKIKGVASAEANPSAKTLTVTGAATEADIRAAVEQAGFDFKGTT